MGFERMLQDLQARKERTLQQGGPERVRKQHDAGRLTARERIDKLLDPESFTEVGQLNYSDMPGMEEKTPADGVIAGYGTINGRKIGIIANDFTTQASTMARVNSRKTSLFKTQVVKYGYPLIWLGEAGGARIPDIQGTKGMFSFTGHDPRCAFAGYVHERTVPMITAVFGECYGVPTWQASIADFTVQVKGSALAVSGPRALGKAIGQSFTGEEIGGWEIHAKITGIADQVAENEEDCFNKIKEFLDYMPSNNQELPPYRKDHDTPEHNCANILDYLPERRTRTYDMHKIIECIVDGGKYLEIKPYFGRTVITCLSRINGHVVGFLANNPAVNVGAMDTDGLDKSTCFMCLCDSYNIPIVFLQDIPGFLVGKDAELKRVPVKVVNNINALSQVTVPKITIIVRKIYGQTVINMCGPGAGADFIVAWPTAEIGFMAPEIAADVVFGSLPEEQRRQFITEMIKDSGPYPAAGEHFIHDVIDPRDTRDYIVKVLEIVRDSADSGMSQHLLANWPSKV